MNNLTTPPNDISQHVTYRKKVAELKYPPKNYIRPEYINKVVKKLRKYFNQSK